MALSGLHLLITLRCTYECEHCFVWGSPQNSATMTLEKVRQVICQARELEGCRWIYFEGGEPFLYYSLLTTGVREAAEAGFKVGIVSNGYWATSLDDARENLRPFAGLLDDLSVSSDLFHGSQRVSPESAYIRQAAEELRIPFDVISVCSDAAASGGPDCESGVESSSVRFRGRAAEKLVTLESGKEARLFTDCPYEKLEDPGRIHVDPSGNLHICQGIVIGNLFEKPLPQILEEFDSATHPIVGPLLEGGPFQLAERYELPVGGGFNDACHLCYNTRKNLLTRFEKELAPREMYGLGELQN